MGAEMCEIMVVVLQIIQVRQHAFFCIIECSGAERTAFRPGVDDVARWLHHKQLGPFISCMMYMEITMKYGQIFVSFMLRGQPLLENEQLHIIHEQIHEWMSRTQGAIECVGQCVSISGR